MAATPLYGLTYPDRGEPMRLGRQHFQHNAETTEAAIDAGVTAAQDAAQDAAAQAGDAAGDAAAAASSAADAAARAVTVEQDLAVVLASVAGDQPDLDGAVAGLVQIESATAAALGDTYGVVLPDPTGADDAPLFTAAFAASPVVRARPGRRYRLAQTVTVPAGATLDLTGATVELAAGANPAAMFAATGAVQGTRAAPMSSLTAAAAPGATVLEVNTTADLAVGDVLLLGDDVEVLQPANQQPRYRGELVRVAAKTATTLTLAGPLRDGYTVAAAGGLQRLLMAANITVRGGVLTNPYRGQTTTRILTLTRCAGVHLDGLTIRGGDSAGITLTHCLDVTITDPVVSDLTDDKANGRFGYGILLAGATEGVTVTGGSFARVRHAITTGGVDHERGQPRRVVVTGAVATQTTGAAFDTHAHGDSITFSGCLAESVPLYGFQIRSRRTRLIGCTVRDSGSHGVQIAEAAGSKVELDGLSVSAAGGHGVHVSGAVTEVAVRSSAFFDLGGSGVAVSVDNAHRLVVSDCQFRNLGRTQPDSAGVLFTPGKYSNGHVIGRNLFVRDTGGPANYTVGVSLPASVTASFVHENMAVGLPTDVIDAGNNTKLSNSVLDGRVNTIEGVIARVGRVDLTVPGAASRALAFAVGVPVGTYTPMRMFEVALSARNSTTGARIAARYVAYVVRDGGAAYVAGGTLEQIRGTGFALGSGSGGDLTITHSVTADGATLTVNLANNTANNQSATVTVRGL